MQALILASLGLLIALAVSVVGRTKPRRWLAAASAAAVIGMLGVAGLIWFGGQLGDGGQFDAPRERLTISNEGGRPIYVVVPGTSGLSSSDLADTTYFVNGVTAPGQTATVVLREGTWDSRGEACLTDEFLIITSHQDRRDYSDNVRDASGRIVSPEVSANDLAIEHRDGSSCWTESTAHVVWDGNELASGNAPDSLPSWVGWMLAAGLAIAGPQLVRLQNWFP